MEAYTSFYRKLMELSGKTYNKAEVVQRFGSLTDDPKFILLYCWTTSHCHGLYSEDEIMAIMVYYLPLFEESDSMMDCLGKWEPVLVEVITKL